MFIQVPSLNEKANDKMSEIQTKVGNFKVNATETCIPSEVDSFSLRRLEICLFVFMLIIDYQTFLGQVLHGINIAQKIAILLLAFLQWSGVDGKTIISDSHQYLTDLRFPLIKVKYCEFASVIFPNL